MKTLALWLLWLWMAVVTWAAFFYSPLAAGFIGQSSRILFFHVPLAWTSFIAFFAAAFWSIRYLVGQREAPGRPKIRRMEHDRAATVTGALWARIMWGEYWNWDPRQISIILVLIFYGAYLALRGAVPDAEKKARLAAVYAVIGAVVTPFFFFIVPRITFSLHPDSVINARGKVDMDSKMLQVLLAAFVGEAALFFWMHNLDWRLRNLLARRERD
jgi:heme exporter protein C